MPVLPGVLPTAGRGRISRDAELQIYCDAWHGSDGAEPGAEMVFAVEAAFRPCRPPIIALPAHYSRNFVLQAGRLRETCLRVNRRSQLTKSLTRRFLRVSSPSLLRTLETWNFAVRSLMFNWRAISLLVRRLKSSWST